MELNILAKVYKFIEIMKIFALEVAKIWNKKIHEEHKRSLNFYKPNQ